jgi:hypothetical protein
MWFGVPIGATILAQPTLYDNFRHFFFALPPLFIFSSMGIEEVMDKVKLTTKERSYGIILLIFILLAPGFYYLVKLHPYQYIYYNAITKGVGGAYQKFEMDYWGTSFKEATEYLNSIAPQGSKVVTIFWEPHHIVKTYSRPDLIIEVVENPQEINCDDKTYAILSSRFKDHIDLFTYGQIIITTGRESAVFSVIKDLECHQESTP